MPIQVDEIRELTVLAKDAAGIMWEMVAMNESGPAAAEMQANAQQLQVRAWALVHSIKVAPPGDMLQATSPIPTRRPSCEA